VATEEKVNLREKLELFSDHWRPRQVATLNDYKVLLVKVEGEFVWHSHPETDDFFLVVDGVVEIQLRDRTVTLGPGELFVVPAGVEHCPRARFEAHVLLIEPIGTVNTGDAQAGDLTTEPQPL
jgi:mannose-6-phosphate isomerase-like protein (cupin superfamily)